MKENVNEDACKFCIYKFECSKQRKDWTFECEVLKQKVNLQPEKERN